MKTTTKLSGFGLIAFCVVFPASHATDKILQTVLQEHMAACPKQEQRVSKPAKGTAVSLRRLEKHLKTCKSEKECEKPLYSMGKILGFIIDKKNKDIVLFGERGNMTYIGDFVVALRHHALRYAKRRGNTRIISPMACSLDPPESLFQQLRKASGVTDSYCKVCDETPHYTSVYGIPKSSRLANICLIADHAMKSFTGGKFEELVGVSDLSLKIIGKQVEAGRNHITSHVSGVNRFWFNSGNSQYSFKNNTLLLQRQDVHLSTEISGKNKTGIANPLATAVSKCFSRQFPTISNKFSIFSELENLYRISAVTNIAINIKAFEKAIYSPDFWLDSYNPRRFDSIESLMGVVDVKSKTFKIQKSRNRVSTLTITAPSCGGGDLSTNPKKVVSHNNYIRHLKKIIYATRPSNAITWNWKMENLKLAGN